jgi:hypothetical protein
MDLTPRLWAHARSSMRFAIARGLSIGRNRYRLPAPYKLFLIPRLAFAAQAQRRDDTDDDYVRGGALELRSSMQCGSSNPSRSGPAEVRPEGPFLGISPRAPGSKPIRDGDKEDNGKVCVVETTCFALISRARHTYERAIHLWHLINRN